MIPVLLADRFRLAGAIDCIVEVRRSEHGDRPLIPHVETLERIVGQRSERSVELSRQRTTAIDAPTGDSRWQLQVAELEARCADLEPDALRYRDRKEKERARRARKVKSDVQTTA